MKQLKSVGEQTRLGLFRGRGTRKALAFVLALKSSGCITLSPEEIRIILDGQVQEVSDATPDALTKADSNIDTGASDSGVDNGIPDATTDTATIDAATDTGTTDATSETVTPDASTDTGVADASVDTTTPDASTDSGTMDVTSEAATPDASGDTSVADAGPTGPTILTPPTGTASCDRVIVVAPRCNPGAADCYLSLSADFSGTREIVYFPQTITLPNTAPRPIIYSLAQTPTQPLLVRSSADPTFRFHPTSGDTYTTRIAIFGGSGGSTLLATCYGPTLHIVP